MEDNQFEKRMDVLKKSYERTPSSFDYDKTLRRIEEDSTKRIPGKSNTLRKNITVWAISIASIFIIGFLTATFLLSEDREQAAKEEVEITDQFHLELEESYKEERDKLQEELKMEDELFNRLHFIKLADNRIDQLLKTNNAKITSKKEIKIEIDKVIETLKLPSEMVANLLLNPLTNDETGSIAFMTDYRSKVTALIDVYNEALTEMNKPDMIINRSRFYKMVGVMKSQNIRYLDDNKYMEFTEAIYILPENYTAIRDSLHEDVHGDLEMMIDEHRGNSNDFAAQFAFENGVYSIEGNLTPAEKVLKVVGAIEEIVEEITRNGQGKLYSSNIKVDLTAGSKIFTIEGVDKDTVIAVEIGGQYYTAIYTRKLN